VYELIVSLDGCTNSTSISVVVNEKPIASVMGTTPVCEGETVDLSAANAGTVATYSWTGPEGFTSNLQNPSFDNAVPSQSGFYVMTATLGDCSARDSVDIIVNPKPTLSITSAMCLPNLLTYEVKLTASGGMVTTSAGEITDDGNGEFTINKIISGTNIVVTVTSDEDCVVSQEITAPDCSCPVVDAPISEGDEIICRTEDNPVLSVTVGADETVDWYTTASGGATILENSLTFTPSETAVGTQTYYAQTRNTINQCVSSTRTEVKLTIKPKPEVTVDGISPICQDDTIRLSSSADLAGVSYQWSGPNGFTAATQNVNIPSAKVNDSGFYKLVVDLNGCTDADSVEITVKPKPTPIANSNSPVCEGFPINLSVNETAATTYVWSGPKN
ncbi:MAG: hypothetical protein NWP83_03480, partial [Spirosomaceae bacterium]|nr:hypothetical protein [Spirosomataceae bacterium]